MSKMFFEVFPTLVVQEDLKKLMTGIEVTKVSANRQKNVIRIFLYGTHLIPKADIFRMEKEIIRQLFKDRQIDVKIIEKFQLSEQYSAESLMDIYGESIKEELKAYSLLIYNVFRTAKITFLERNRMKLVLEDTMIARERAEELIRILEKIFCERCGVDFIAELSFELQKEDKRKKSDYIINQEIQNVIRQASFEGEIEKPEQPTKIAEKENPPTKETNRRQSKVQEKRTFRSSNPDVVYGRDFDEECIPIEKITG